MSVRVFFAWYDFWIGAFVDRAARAVYICPLPMLVIRIGRPAPTPAEGGEGTTGERP